MRTSTVWTVILLGAISAQGIAQERDSLLQVRVDTTQKFEPRPPRKQPPRRRDTASGWWSDTLPPDASAPLWIPGGIEWIVNTKTKRYYAVACLEGRKVPRAYREFYASEADLIAAGYAKGETC